MLKMETVFENKNIHIKDIELKSGKIITFVDNTKNTVAVLPFIRENKVIKFFAKDELIPFWNPSQKEVVAISYTTKTNVETKQQTIDFINKEFETKINAIQLIHLGNCRISTIQSGVVELYSADLSEILFDATSYIVLENLTDVSDPILYTLVNKAKRLVF